MNAVLSNYVKKNYEDGKADLFAVFMQVAEERLADKGKYGMINMQSWMFLSSFEKLRTRLLDIMQINSMLHLGPRTFDELSGEVVQNTAFVVTKHSPDSTGSYYRLVDGRSCGDKERMFLAGKHYYPHVSQQNFKKIPGCPVGYWVSERMIEAFGDNNIDSIATVLQGIIPGNVNAFIRFWFEPSTKKIGWKHKNYADIMLYCKKWFPYNKGGSFRRWYGNIEYVINMENNGYDIRYSGLNNNYRLRNPNYYFKQAVSWSKIASDSFATRFIEEGTLFDIAGCCIFDLEDDIYYVLGLTNSPLCQGILNLISPTLNYEVEHIKNIPVKIKNKTYIDTLVSQNISISRADWDAHETSWDFEENELVRLSKEQGEGSHRLSELMDAYKEHWTEQFHKLHDNEEELNRQFIEIYGLQDELSPDVPPEEITIPQQGEISIENNQLIWNDDVIIKQLLSYAVGCMMGRYRLDKPGLHIAHLDPTDEEVCTYSYKGQDFTIDEDGIIPLMTRDCPFPDNAPERFKHFLKVALGEDALTENLNFIEAALGKDIETYFVKDFWKDHLSRYQRRPIYWLFSSKKGAFQCIAYMHRMNPYTVEQIRNKYLLPHMEYLGDRITEMENRAAALTAKERKLLEKFRKDLDECREYIGGKQFRDKVNDADMEGNLLHQFETIMSFFTRNLKSIQVEKDFNSLGKLEIPYSSLVEFVVNALVHRSLNWNAPIRIFIFDNRVEIHSPGILPNGLQVEDITNGTSMPRNNFLFSNAIYLLPYTGAGTGIQRALEDGLQVEFKNDERTHEFFIIIARNPDLGSNSDTDSDTKFHDSDTVSADSDKQLRDRL